MSTGSAVGSGGLNAVFIGDPNSIGDPNAFAGDLHGLMLGGFEDPNERTGIWLVNGSLDRGGRAFSGAIGDPTLMPASAILFPNVC